MTTVRDFEELRVRVRRIGAQRYLVLVNGAAQDGRAIKIGADPAVLRDEFNRLVDIDSGNAPAGSTNTPTALRRLGRSVYDLLFDDTLTSCLRQAKDAAEALEHGLRLRFDLPPDLHTLPVETLCSPSDQPEQTLALNANMSIVRSLAGGQSRHRLPAGDDQSEVLHLLVAIATPEDADLPRIDVDAELAGLGKLPDFFVQTDIVRDATLADIEKWLTDNADRPTAVLLIAHGSYAKGSDEGVVILDAGDGTAHQVPGHLLSGLLVRARRLRLVVLNLCFSAWNSVREPFGGLAQAMIGQGIPAVVAMHGLVTDRAAGVLGPKLLAGICANNTVDEALTSARQHIANLPGHTTIEWATPMLFLDAACGHGWLFKAREVREDESTDPLRAGEQALEQLRANGNIRPATAFAAARFLRLRGDWRQVESIAKAVQPADTRLITEARSELAWPAVEHLCAALAEGDLPLAREHLDGVRELLPASVLRLCDREIVAAAAVDDLIRQARQAADADDWQSTVDLYERVVRDQPPGVRDVTAELACAREELTLAEHYSCLLAHHDAEEWEAGLADANAILALRAGHRDTAIRAAYLTARIAEAKAHWPDAVSGYAACGGFADAPARLAHARGQLAADLGDWRAAARHFRAAAELGEDHWAGYAAGRAAELDGDWDVALRHYAELPDTVLDIGARTSLANGMLADARGDWTGAVKEFGALPADFAYGEVGRRRQFALARLAEQRLDWPGVLTLLGATPDAGCAGSVGVLRWTARGRQAEADGDWALAARCFATVEGAEDLALDHRYATARRSEAEEHWTAAIDAYTTLPRDHRDVEVRIGYARARAAEVTLDWARARDLYAALPADFADAAVRSAYAGLRALVAIASWAPIPDLAEELGEHRDAAGVAAYAAGRLAEERADWAGAVAAYESGGAFADAAIRAAYARARQLDAAGRWSTARDAYAEAAEIDRDVRRRIARLDFLLTELPFAEGIAEATLVANPVALRDPVFPYLALGPVGVTPATPTEVVTDAAFMLMERGGISWSERVAWDRLRTPARRLLVEARMYRLREPAALGRALAELEPATTAAPLSWLCARLPADTPLLILLGGDWNEASRLWRQRLAARPGDQDDVHCLALASFWQAQDLEEAGEWERTAPMWRTALACFATLLTGDEFWARFRAHRASAYGHAVIPADIRLLRVELGRYLISELTAHAQRHADAGRQQEADRYQRLLLLFEAELDAAWYLKQAGGLPLRGGADRLSCGPEYLRLVGLSLRLGEFIAEQHRQPLEDELGRELLRRLRCAFSALSTASTSLEHHRFESALRLLPEYHRMRRLELPADCAGPAGHDDVGDCEHCREFVESDPAYAYLPDRRVRRWLDAVGLAVRARLSIAHELLGGGRLDAALTELTAAIDIATTALIGARAGGVARRMVMGSAARFAASSRGTVHGIDVAIELVEKAVALIGDSPDRELTRKLADLLVDRGVWYSSACRKFGRPPEHARAVVELRRACRLDPDSHRPRANLAHELALRAGELPVSADRLALLVEALRHIEDGLVDAGPRGRLREALFLALDSVTDVVLAALSESDLHELIQSLGGEPGAVDAATFAEQAARLRADGDLSRCAYHLVRAVRECPWDRRYRADLLTVAQELLTGLREGRTDP